MNPQVKSLAKKVLSGFKYLPFVNSFRRGGAKVDLRNTVAVRTKIRCKGKNNTIIFRDGMIRNSKITIHGSNNRIEIGNHTTIIEGDLYIEDDGNVISIGENTQLCGKTHLACTEGRTIQIGKDCLFSSDLVFRTGDSHSLLDLEGNRINPASDIVIGDHVWIGHKVLINKGVTIQPHSMIGTGAVVTKRFEQGHVCIAGVPAKIVKEDIDWCTKRL